MKRTVTIRVEVADDDEYADVVSRLLRDSNVITAHCTGGTKRFDERMRNPHGVVFAGDRRLSAQQAMRRYS